MAFDRKEVNDPVAGSKVKVSVAVQRERVRLSLECPHAFDGADDRHGEKRRPSTGESWSASQTPFGMKWWLVAADYTKCATMVAQGVRQGGGGLEPVEPEVRMAAHSVARPVRSQLCCVDPDDRWATWERGRGWGRWIVLRAPPNADG